LALIAIGLEKDDVVIMPAINFIAVYNMARLMNAKIFLADVDPLTGQMTPKTLLKCIKNNKLKRIKVIVTMYLGGYPENIIEFYNIKKKFNCYLIEDACHALGAKYLFNKNLLSIGSCKHSDISTFSLHPVKTITTGEGGLITTNNKFFYNRIISFRSHGIDKDKNFHWKYNLSKSGFNYRLSDINAALGLSQLKKINKFIKFRRQVCNYYKKNLEQYRNIISLPKYNNKNFSSFHLFIISINFKKKITKDIFFKFFKKKKINCQFHYIPIYKFNFYNKLVKLKHYKGAEYYFRNSVSLPIFYNLNSNMLSKILDQVRLFLKLKL
jgi:dTDP-4-amino-4,6-dideoxygalactose transaminase